MIICGVNLGLRRVSRGDSDSNYWATNLVTILSLAIWKFHRFATRGHRKIATKRFMTILDNFVFSYFFYIFFNIFVNLAFRAGFLFGFIISRSFGNFRLAVTFSPFWPYGLWLFDAFYCHIAVHRGPYFRLRAHFLPFCKIIRTDFW